MTCLEANQEESKVAFRWTYSWTFGSWQLSKSIILCRTFRFYPYTVGKGLRGDLSRIPLRDEKRGTRKRLDI